MFDLEAIIATIGPELLLAGAGLVGVLIGALLKDGFNSLSFKVWCCCTSGGSRNDGPELGRWPGL